MTRGVAGWGVYVPRRRIPRHAIADALVWRQPPGTRKPAGERSYAAWDEDAITLAVEAARDALGGDERSRIRNLTLASTTLPFADRSNAGLVAAALNLGARVGTEDTTGSQRAATSALISALERSGADGHVVVASERRRTQPGSSEELAYGDGAAAVLVATDGVVAQYLGACSEAVDFVDHYRESKADYDYSLEERWVRVEGMQKLVLPAAKGLLERLSLQGSDVSHLVTALPAATSADLARRLGCRPTAVREPLVSRLGHAGSAQILLELAATLESAVEGEVIVVVGFGQGVDVLALVATGAIANRRRSGLGQTLADGLSDPSYTRFLAHGGELNLAAGMRAERDARTAHSVQYRKHPTLNGLIGGRCTRCGTVQFPKAPACVNPDCRAFGNQDDAPLADEPAQVKTYTEDWLAYTPSPPLVYGNVATASGANLFIEFTDCGAGELEVGMPLRFVFRVKDVDRVRGFHRYFWKATRVRS